MKQQSGKIYYDATILNATWLQIESDPRQVLTYMQRYDLPEIIAKILVSRNILLNDVDDFLNPTLRASLPNPSSFLDMDKAAIAIIDAIKNQQKIAVFGDYDVDGATSSALLNIFLQQCGVEPVIYIPDRIEEGYGPNSKALIALREQGVDICITVDCGISSFEPLADAEKVGLKMIIVDHHIGSPQMPIAHAIVNPNRFDEGKQYGYMAAVGVTFMLLVALNKRLRECNWYDENNITPPNLINLLDIVALGTVCDVVPLIGVNRAFVAQGLKILKNRKNIGLNALADIAKINEEPGTYHFGFVLGPRINAGGRVGKSSYGSQLLASNDQELVTSIAGQLDVFNKERRAIESFVLEDSIMQVEKSGDIKPVIFAASRGWHPGVIGIVASRIKDKYHRPTAVISIEDGIGKASARSISGVDFGSAIIAAKEMGLIMAGGGHKMAGGFTVKEDKIEHLQEFFIEHMTADINDNCERKSKFEGFLSVSAITPDLISQINTLGPFGVGNPEPKFVISNAYVAKVNVMKEKHVMCFVADASGNRSKTIKAVCFNSMDNGIGEALINAQGSLVNLLGKPKINSWQGVDRVEFFIEDVAII